MTTATVVRTFVEGDHAVLELDCEHYTVVPRDDEEALSFMGATVECDRHEFDPIGAN